jgi:hypothetical protein
MNAIWSMVNEVKLTVEIATITHSASTAGAEAYTSVFCLLNDMKIFNAGVADLFVRFLSQRWLSSLKCEHIEMLVCLLSF